MISLSGILGGKGREDAVNPMDSKEGRDLHNAVANGSCGTSDLHGGTTEDRSLEEDHLLRGDDKKPRQAQASVPFR